MPGNVCESSSFFSFYPFGAVFGLGTVLYSRQKRIPIKPELVVLSLLEIILLSFAFIGLPSWLAKITLLSHSTGPRVVEMIGYLDLMIALLSAMELHDAFAMKREVGRGTSFIAFVLLLGFALLYVWLALIVRIDPNYALYASAAFSLLCLSLIRIVSGSPRASWLLCLVAFVVSVSGITVNPLQRGTTPLDSNAIANGLEEYTKSADVWIADDDSVGQLLVANGMACINSVNTCPHLDRWHRIDSPGQFEDAYNRYAHIFVQPTMSDPEFSSSNPDRFDVSLSLFVL